MKIGFTGIDLPEGKIKYIDENLNALVKKDNPRKVTPYYVKFIRDEFLQTEAIVVLDDSILDLLIIDMEKIEARLSRLNDGDEKKLWLKCLEHLENEQPLSEVQFTETELAVVKTMEMASDKPVYRATRDEDINTIITGVFEQAGYMFFYTSWPDESHAWLIKKGTDIVTCAAKIHTDLARGFIKADVVPFDDYLRCHNLNDCKTKNLVKLVDRSYIVQQNDVIEIRFNL